MTSTAVTPARFAHTGRSAAGWTVNEVPTQKEEIGREAAHFGGGKDLFIEHFSEQDQIRPHRCAAVGAGKGLDGTTVGREAAMLVAAEAVDSAVHFEHWRVPGTAMVAIDILRNDRQSLSPAAFL